MIISFHLFQSLYVFIFYSLVVTMTSSKVLSRLVIMGILVLLLILEVGGRVFQYFTIYYMGILDLPFFRSRKFLLLVTSFCCCCCLFKSQMDIKFYQMLFLHLFGQSNFFPVFFFLM